MKVYDNFKSKKCFGGSHWPTWINVDTGSINFVTSTPMKKIKLIETEFASSETFIMNYLMIVTIRLAVFPKGLLIFGLKLILIGAFNS